MSGASPLDQGSPHKLEQTSGLVWKKYEESQTALQRALKENEDLRHKHACALKKIDGYLVDFKKTVAEKDEEIAKLTSQASTKETASSGQLEGDGYREEVEAILEGLPNSVPGETSFEKLSNLVQQHENSSALKQSLLELRADFHRLKSTHNAPAPEMAQLQEEVTQMKEENNDLKTRLVQLSNQVDQLQQEMQDKEAGKQELCNEIMQLKAELSRSEQGLQQADKDRDVEQKKLLQELESLRKEREAKAGVVVKQEGRIKVLEQALAKSKEDLQIATKLRSSLDAARSMSPDLRSQRKNASSLEAKLKPLETQLAISKESVENERAAKERLELERKRLYSEKTELESRIVTLEMQAKEKEGEIVLLTGRVESQEAELRSKQQKLKELGDVAKVKLQVTDLQSQVSKLEQENQQLKRRQTKQLGTKDPMALSKSRGGSTSSLGAGEAEEAVGDQLQSPKAENEAMMKQVQREREASQALLAQKQQALYDVESKLRIAEAETSHLKSKLERFEHSNFQDLSEPLQSVQEERDSLLEEKQKLEDQLAEMVQTVAKSTAAREKAEDELKTKLHQLRKTESQLAKRLRELAAKDEDLRQARVDLELEKKRMISLQAEMLSLKEWSESREALRAHNEVDREVLQKLTERSEALQQQVHQEQLQRLTLQQKEAELMRCLEQETAARSQLQEEAAARDARLHELEMKVKAQRERTKSLTEQVRLSKEESDDLRHQANHCEDHLRATQMELQSREEQLGADLKRANLHKRRSLEKLHSSREKHSRQRLSLESSLSSLKDEMQQSHLRLQQEEQWRDSLEKSCKRLQQEKAHVQGRLSTIEGDAKEWKWKMAEKESQIAHLHKENQLLEEKNKMLISFNDRIEAVSRDVERKQALSSSLDSRLASRLWTAEMT